MNVLLLHDCVLLDSLSKHIDKREAQIKDICALHYDEFIGSIGVFGSLAL